MVAMARPITVAKILEHFGCSAPASNGSLTRLPPSNFGFSDNHG